LENYHSDPGDSFWENFPFRALPTKAESSINVKELRNLINKNSAKLNKHQLKRAKRVCRDISRGGDAYQLSDLPPVCVPNTSSAYEHGRMLTDKIATWVEKGFVAGPFKYPPVANCRLNPMMAISRNNAVRPVINMSAPPNASFNSNVNYHALEKVYMCTAQQFSFSVVEAGVNAVMSKFDLSDAYKCIPAALKDLRLQGFKWLNRLFFETRMIFGAVPSVCNFDRLGNTLLTLATCIAGIPFRWVHRCLDDIPIVTPAGSGFCERFSAIFLKICSIIGIGLAPVCARNEKAFINQTRGTVLGITFDTTDLTWTFPADKLQDLQLRLLTAVKFPLVSLKQVQELIGSINSFAQLCPIAKCFRQPLNNFIREFNSSQADLIRIPEAAIRDLTIISNIVQFSGTRLPIAARRGGAPIFALEFTSDAAGSNFAMQNGERVCKNTIGDRGVCSLGHNGNNITFCCRLRWPILFLNCARDRKGAFYGSKTTTLELIGLILPFLTIPDRIVGKHVILGVDNEAIWHGWNSRGLANDVSGSILIRGLYLISYYLGATIHIKHVPRLSTDMSAMADRLSRASTTEDRDLAMLKHVQQPDPPMVLLDWLNNPVEDWDIAYKLLYHVQSMLNV